MTPVGRAYRTVGQLHEHEELLAWAETPGGRLGIWLLAALLLRPFPVAWLVLPVVALVMWRPGQRRLVLSAAAVVGLVAALGGEARAAGALPAPWLVAAAVSLLLLAALYGVYAGAVRFASLPGVTRRRPQLWLHAALWAAVALVWSRFYYYFKELLVDFFFLPTYVRWSRARPRVRMLAATFAAAFAGNLYYQLILAGEALVAPDLGGIAADLAPRVVYSALLAAGIYVSLLRQQARRGRPGGAPGGLRRWRAIAGVWTFYAVIHLWNLRAEGLGLGPRTAFFLWLLGL